MTRIQLVSDLHMEFASINLENAGAETLILSGDIVVANYFDRGEASTLAAKAREWREWFENVCAQFENVIYVLGNHEHYKGKFYDTAALLRRTLGHIRNLHILDNETIDLDGVRFFGTTLWTDFNRDDFAARHYVQSGLNDYRLIQGQNYRELQPVETLLYHRRALQLLDQYQPQVVVGHHAPSYRSIEPRFRDSGLLNYGYYSDLERFIADRDIQLWTHGHVHSSHDYTIANTRVVANPRGYDQGRGPENKQFNPNLILEI